MFITKTGTKTFILVSLHIHVMHSDWEILILIKDNQKRDSNGITQKTNQGEII